jgi:Mn-dependent DtxR family transcriptional regulator
MGSGILTLDQIWSATSHFSMEWSAGLESNKAHRVLHYLLCRLYDEGRGQLVNAHLTLAQTTLSKKLGISRQWIGELVSRLEQTGWIAHHSEKLPDGTNGSTVWRVGRLLKRLLVMLSKSRRGEKQGRTPANTRWHFSPTKVEKEISFILAKEKVLPAPEVIARIPMLKRWLERGKEKPGGEG